MGMLQMTEKEFDQFYNNYLKNNCNYNYDEIKQIFINHGYIYKSATEEAEEMYDLYQSGNMENCMVITCFDKMYKAIQELKIENETLKKLFIGENI